MRLKIVANALPGMDVDAMAAYFPMIEVTIDDLVARGRSVDNHWV